mgnify:CR=1 FL=1
MNIYAIEKTKELERELRNRRPRWFSSRHKSRKSSSVGSRDSSSDGDGQSSAITSHPPPRACETGGLPAAHECHPRICARQSRPQ